MDDLIGKTLERFQILELVKAGRSWTVYLAYDPKLQRYVTLKRLNTRLGENIETQETILRSVRNAIRLRHPGLARVYDLGQEGKWFYQVAEYVPGQDLGRLMAEMRRSELKVGLVEAVLVVHEIALAMDYARSRGFSVADLRISDLMLKTYKEGDPIRKEEPALPYQPVLVDLGYEPQATGGIEENDLFGLVTILYELVTGYSPSEKKVVIANPLRALMQRAFSNDPEKKFSNAGQFAQALLDILPNLQEVDPTPVSSSSITPLMAVHQQKIAALPVRGPFEDQEKEGEGQPEKPLDVKGESRLRVLDADHRVRFLTISPHSTITIGRSRDCEINIDQNEVSRRHAQITFDGNQFRVTDLGSANGSILADRRLLANVPQIWKPGEILKIGATLVQIEQTEDAAKDTTVAIPVGGKAPQKFIVKEGAIELAIDHANLVSAPGQTVNLDIATSNLGVLPDIYSLNVSGLPEGWFSFSENDFSLEAGEQKVIQLKITIPRTSSARAGRRPLLLKARTKTTPDQTAEARVNLTITTFNEMSWEIQPARIMAGQPFQVGIQNLGNVPQVYEVRCEDPQHSIIVSPPAARVVVPEGQKAAVRFTSAASKLRFFGETRSHKIQAQIKSADQSVETKTTQVLSSALLPGWALLGLLGAAFVGALIGVVLLSGFFLNNYRVDRATQAAGTALAQVVMQTEQSRLATEQSLSGAGISTQLAATTTAIWLDADDDRDGLSNRDELERGTLPNERDTDQDGVSDGEETARGLNPLEADSDGDSLKDGDEIARGLNPLDRDTDKDGIPDGEDPDPGKLPTSTITPTLIASNTPTITPTPTLTRTVTVTPTVTLTQLTNPVPVISGLSPNSVLVGGTAFVLTINGSGFINGSQASWNGSPRNTTFQSANTLFVQIPAADLVIAGSFPVIVTNPSPGGGVSEAKNFLVANPSPIVNSVNPNSKTVYDSQFTLQVLGANFVNGSSIFWNGQPKNTSFVSPSELSAVIPAADLLTVGIKSISVVNPQPGGGSAAINFTVNNPVPTLQEIQPTETPISETDVTIEVTGTNFVTDSVVVWDENNAKTNLTTTFIDSQSLEAVIPASLLQEVKNNIKITVVNSSPGGGESNFVLFAVVENSPSAEIIGHKFRLSESIGIWYFY